MFGENALGDVGHQGQDKAMSMADTAEVCGCNGVCKGTIVKAIQEHGLFSVDEVKKHTKAASSCGSCAGLVEQILINTVGGAADVKPKSEKAICGCSDLNHGQIRQAIREQHLLTIAGTLSYLNWRTPNSCATCRPGAQLLPDFHLAGRSQGRSAIAPDQRARHANIQKDGTCSVVPRMWGWRDQSFGTAAHCRRCRQVQRANGQGHRRPAHRLAGDQEAGLARRLERPRHAVRPRLRQIHPHREDLRRREFCRFGTQNSTQLGIELEHDLFNMWSPHKVKLAVSGCPRNCSEAGIKDVGIIGVDSGWEMYIGGNGGIKTEVAEFFVKLKTAEEVREYNGAFLQLYREEAFYLERTVHYLQRVGMDHIKKAVLEDPQRRKALNDRLQFSLSFEAGPVEGTPGTATAEKEFDVIPVKNLEVLA